ncbi:MAG: 5'-deoxynucleotidase [Eubacteriales bacterium]|nr:5'-deoxynucleotidase [Eubacteriales bacterium]
MRDTNEPADNSFHFFAMLHRMRYINRWGLMRNTEQENIQEHSLQVALIAHALVLFRRHYYSEGRICPSAEMTALLGMFHDASEILTGDLPTPVKYFNPQIRDSYKMVEEVATEKLLSMLPEELRTDYRDLMLPSQETPELAEAIKFVKAADKLSAYIKCLDEEKAGNPEFVQARNSLRNYLQEVDMPEVKHFIDHFLPSYKLTLDQLSDE